MSSSSCSSSRKRARVGEDQSDGALVDPSRDSGPSRDGGGGGGANATKAAGAGAQRRATMDSLAKQLEEAKLMVAALNKSLEEQKKSLEEEKLRTAAIVTERKGLSERLLTPCTVCRVATSKPLKMCANDHEICWKCAFRMIAWHTTNTEPCDPRLFRLRFNQEKHWKCSKCRAEPAAHSDEDCVKGKCFAFFPEEAYGVRAEAAQVCGDSIELADPENTCECGQEAKAGDVVGWLRHKFVCKNRLFSCRVGATRDGLRNNLCRAFFGWTDFAGTANAAERLQLAMREHAATECTNRVNVCPGARCGLDDGCGIVVPEAYGVPASEMKQHNEHHSEVDALLDLSDSVAYDVRQFTKEARNNVPVSKKTVDGLKGHVGLFLSAAQRIISLYPPTTKATVYWKEATVDDMLRNHRAGRNFSMFERNVCVPSYRYPDVHGEGLENPAHNYDDEAPAPPPPRRPPPARAPAPVDAKLVAPPNRAAAALMAPPNRADALVAPPNRAAAALMAPREVVDLVADADVAMPDAPPPPPIPAPIPAAAAAVAAVAATAPAPAPAGSALLGPVQ